MVVKSRSNVPRDLEPARGLVVLGVGLGGVGCGGFGLRGPLLWWGGGGVGSVCGLPPPPLSSGAFKRFFILRAPYREYSPPEGRSSKTSTLRGAVAFRHICFWSLTFLFSLNQMFAPFFPPFIL